MFEGLFPEPYNEAIMDLLFLCAHWHGLAKLRMHTDQTLELLDQVTISLSTQFRYFVNTVCPNFKTRELPREALARSRRQKQLVTEPDLMPHAPHPTPGNIPAETLAPFEDQLNGLPSVPFSNPDPIPSNALQLHHADSASSGILLTGAMDLPLNHTASLPPNTTPLDNPGAASCLLSDTTIPMAPDVIVVTSPAENSETTGYIPTADGTSVPAGRTRRLKEFNLNTYKYHSLADYADMIRKYGTTDSYSTELVSSPSFIFYNQFIVNHRENWNIVLLNRGILEQTKKNTKSRWLGSSGAKCGSVEFEYATSKPETWKQQVKHQRQRRVLITSLENQKISQNILGTL